MSRTSMHTGRTNQKQRTRQDLLDAARALVEAGETPAINRVAKEASVSRATAYRYFPNTQSLLVEMSLDAGFKEPAEVFADEESDAEERVERALRYIFDYTIENEASFRTFLSACVAEAAPGAEGEPIPRGARRERLLREALRGRDQDLSPFPYPFPYLRMLTMLKDDVMAGFSV